MHCINCGRLIEKNHKTISLKFQIIYLTRCRQMMISNYIWIILVILCKNLIYREFLLGLKVKIFLFVKLCVIGLISKKIKKFKIKFLQSVYHKEIFTYPDRLYGVIRKRTKRKGPDFSCIVNKVTKL